MFFTILFTIIFGLQFLVYYTFRKFLLKRNINSKKVNIISRIPFIIFNLPYILFFTKRLGLFTISNELSHAIDIPFYIFQGAIIFIGIYLLIGKVIKFPFILLKKLLTQISTIKAKYNNIRKKKTVVKFDSTRRKFLTASTSAIAGYAFIGAGLGTITKDNYDIIYKEIKLPNASSDMSNLNLLLLSDIHSGPYMDTNQMKEYVEVINSMNPDMIFIPGDLTNSRREEIKPFISAFRDLKSKYGIFSTLGNHDYFHDPQYISDAVKSELPFIHLNNEHRLININDKKLAILGIADTRDSGNNTNPQLRKYLLDTINPLKEELNEEIYSIPKIVLAHKPYFFDDVNDLDFDLMLSGHTHGGQVVFFKFGDFNLSFASSVHKYVSGLYKLNQKQLYVTRGIGTVGLPIRFNCPPEITHFKII